MELVKEQLIEQQKTINTQMNQRNKLSQITRPLKIRVTKVPLFSYEKKQTSRTNYWMWAFSIVHLLDFVLYFFFHWVFFLISCFGLKFSWLHCVTFRSFNHVYLGYNWFFFYSFLFLYMLLNNRLPYTYVDYLFV